MPQTALFSTAAAKRGVHGAVGSGSSKLPRDLPAGLAEGLPRKNLETVSSSTQPASWARGPFLLGPLPADRRDRHLLIVPVAGGGRDCLHWIIGS